MASLGFARRTNWRFCWALATVASMLAPYLVAVAQLAERRVVVADVAGSNPVGHPKAKVGRMGACSCDR